MLVENHKKGGGVSKRASINKGFTLVELLVVIGILSAMATIALNDVVGTVGQQNFDQTVYKMKNIRRAILGGDNVVNGEPVLEGFVVDMGRLPYNLAELLGQQNCKSADYDNETDCEAAGSEWVHMPDYAYEHCSDSFYTSKVDCESASETWIGESYCSDLVYTTEATCLAAASGETWTEVPRLQSGWRGPYISVFSDIDGVTRYRDGWGNKDNTKNFGWVFNASFEDVDEDFLADDGDSLVDQIELRSKGLNNVNDYFDAVDNRYEISAANNEEKELSNFEKPYPPHYLENEALLVIRDDFQLNLGDMKIVFNVQNTDGSLDFVLDKDLCAGLYVIEDGLPNLIISDSAMFVATPEIITAGDVKQVIFTFDERYIPYGKMAFSELSQAGPTGCDEPLSFGIRPDNYTAQYRTWLPRTTLTNDVLVEIDWEVQT